MPELSRSERKTQKGIIALFTDATIPMASAIGANGKRVGKYQ